MLNTIVLFCMHVLRVVHVFRARKGFKRPVEETVEEDKAGAHRPHYEDSDEVHFQVIDHLHGEKWKPAETITFYFTVYLLIIFIPSRFICLYMGHHAMGANSKLCRNLNND